MKSCFLFVVTILVERIDHTGKIVASNEIYKAFSYSKVVKCSGSRWKAVSKRFLNVKINGGLCFNG